MNNLKKLKEKKYELIDQMENLTKDIEMFNSTKFDEMKNELEDINAKISEFENNSTTIQNIRKDSGNKMKLKDMLLNNKSVDLSKINNEGEMIRQDHDAVIKETYEATIEKKVEEECLMYGLVRKIHTASPHNIPIQAEKLDKFLNVKELAEYQKAMPTFDNVVLGAEKYGLLVVLSEELIADSGYNLEGEIQEQLVEAFARTMEGLIINGDVANGVEGLLMAEGPEVVGEGIDYDGLVDMIFEMPKAMRKDAIFVCNERFVKDVMKLKDAHERPLWEVNLNDDGFDGKILGHPVVITPEMAEGNVPAMFVNLQKAMVVGVRKGMELKKSNEVLFLQDAVALKANCRVDAKILNPDAVVKFRVQA